MFLKAKSKFADWIKNRIERYDFIENEDYIGF
ncbi:antA/AntB antirepressor family protein [Tepidibacter hydrothermalis]